ncbi:MAG: hypothetical protein KY445_01655 [Armatimonadetes bacterium]|nr:hypothetical protein [Armatimonadota bacterium]
MESNKEHDKMFSVNAYRTERGRRSHLVAFLGALVGGVSLAWIGFFLGAFIGFAAGAWLGQVVGCGLALRLFRYDRVGVTAFILLLLVPVGNVLSAAILFFTQGNTVPQWVMWVCPTPMLLMPVWARSIALAKQPL